MALVLVFWIGGLIATFADDLFDSEARHPWRSLLASTLWPLRVVFIGYEFLELVRWNQLIYGSWRRGTLKR